MPKYLFMGSYTAEGTKGVVKEGGSGRRTAIKSVIEGMGGSVESVYFGFGTHDSYVIADMPSNAAAAALAIRVGAAGGSKVDTIVLMTPEEVDEAVKTPVTFRPPGQ